MADEAASRQSDKRGSQTIGTEAWLNRITTNKASMDNMNMLPVAAQGQFDPEVMRRDTNSLYKRLKRMDRCVRAPDGRDCAIIIRWPEAAGG